MKIPSGEPGTHSCARAADLSHRAAPSATYRWGYAPVVGGRIHSPDTLWFKTQRASRSWARQQLGACALMEYCT